MKQLFKFEWYAGRGGIIGGLFIATQEQVDAIIGKRLWLGEALGKHSEVSGVIEDDEIERVDIDTSAVEVLYEQFGSTISGYNPVERFDDEDDEYDEDDE